VDLIAFLTGARPVAVTAVETRGFLAARGVDTSDTIQAVIRWRGPDGKGFVSDHLSGWIDPERSSAMSDQRLEVVGTGGRYLSDQKDRGITFSSEAGDEKINPYFSQLLPDADGRPRASGYGPRSILTFIRDAGRSRKEVGEIIKNPGLRADFASSAQVAAVCEAVRESVAAGGRWLMVAGEDGQ
jgi:predicted dehydrogenase